MAFFAPNFIWNILYKQTAVQPRGIVKEAQKCVRLCGVQRESEVHNLAEYICDTVSTFTPRGAFEKREFYRSGRNLAILYLITKLLYVVNILGQLYMMNHFLGGHYLYWGYETMLDVAIGKEWSESPIFPRVIMCDFQVRRLGNLQRHTVQCVIMMNMINEKLYLFLWFWFIFVGICTLLNFFYYLFVMGIPRLRAQLVLWNVNKQEMKLAGMSSKDLNRFVNDFLHVDGVLLLKFVNEHVSGRIARELVHDLIRIYARQVCVQHLLIHSQQTSYTQYTYPLVLINYTGCSFFSTLQNLHSLHRTFINESYSPRKNNKAALHPLPRQLCTPTQPYESAPMLEDYIDGQNTLPIGAMARARANQRVPFNENAYAPPSGAPRQTTPTEV
ncbi:unnamed protein product [Anisakis simplex]|uniref:Innexin n=1 Tax=Anisakis simplex TaxID=6269 RepID=A0A0M3KCS0_ANISI|nr:unnamed protein product [Anisakis simplex]